MTLPMAITLVILLLAVVLFVTERLRMDLVALLVLVSLVVTNLVTPAEALSGFSNPAVVTVWAVFVLSAGLSATGVAHFIGRQVLRIAGQGEVRLLILIMLVAAVLSAFMNNVGVAALLLPVVLTMARQTSLPPSKLLMPLAFGCLLGGLTTLIGTPPNILASDALREYGREPFQLFDFAPVGIPITLAGIAYMVLIGRRLLPDRHPMQALAGRNQAPEDTRELYGLAERLALVVLPPDSPLAGRRLAESRIGRALGLTILGLKRQGLQQMTIHPDTVLAGGDQLLALGRLDRLASISQRPYFIVEAGADEAGQLFSAETGLAEWQIQPDSPFIGRSIADIDMRRQYQFNVLAIRRGEQTVRTNLQDLPLASGDTLLLQGDRRRLLAARQMPEFGPGLNVWVAEPETAASYQIQDRLLTILIPPESLLAGQSLAESRLGELFGLVVLGIARDRYPGDGQPGDGHTGDSHPGEGRTSDGHPGDGHTDGNQIKLAPPPDTIMNAGDRLLVEGKPEELAIVRGLQGLVVKRQLDQEQVELESETVGLVEALLSPHTTLVGKTLRDIHFREKYGLSVLAIWRNGRAYRSDLGAMPLQFGDAFLLYGPREKMSLLGREPDFLVLVEEIPEAPRRHKAPVAVLIMTAVVISVLLGWLPIAIAAVAGAALMVVSGCLEMEEGYREIDWRAVFLIAGMLPLGIAMEQSGAAQFLAEGMVAVVGGLGTRALLIGLFVLTSVASQFMPNPVVTVLMAPIAVNTAVDLGLSPQALMMVIAIAASASFMSPVGHPANVLVMGPGGYRFTDFVRAGIPLTLLVLLVTLLVLPVFWPLAP